MDFSTISVMVAFATASVAVSNTPVMTINRVAAMAGFQISPALLLERPHRH
jgi:hypothetical protein